MKISKTSNGQINDLKGKSKKSGKRLIESKEDDCKRENLKLALKPSSSKISKKSSQIQLKKAKNDQRVQKSSQ